MRFIELLVKQNQNIARRMLPELLSGTPLNYWQFGDAVPNAGFRILIAIATWSGYDLRLLDALREAIGSKSLSDERIDVFDLGNCADIDDLEKLVPGIGKVYGTPIVGVWREGVLLQKGFGFAGRELITRRYNLDHAKIVNSPTFNLRSSAADLFYR